MMIKCPACQSAVEVAPGTQIPYVCSHCGSKFVGPYCDLVRVGCGAMGDVFRAQRPNMGNRTVAIKIPKVVTEQLNRRFEREIAASARLHHEHIVYVFDRGDIDGVPFLVMEYVDGRSLKTVIEEDHPISCRRAATIVRGIAVGLAHAAKCGIVNRDLKPENILLTDDDTPKILDYGLAIIRNLDGSADRVTRDGVLLGTAAFMAPEQAKDAHDVTILADVYALGCTAFNILTGTTPFQGSDQLCRLHAEAPRPSVSERRSDVPADLDHLVRRMISIDPSQRPWPTELVAELDRVILALGDSVSDDSAPASAAVVAAGVTHDGMIDVQCPDCKEPYRLGAESIGRWMFCTNDDCGERFRVRPVHAMPEPHPTFGYDGEPPELPVDTGDGAVFVGHAIADDELDDWSSGSDIVMTADQSQTSGGGDVASDEPSIVPDDDASELPPVVGAIVGDDEFESGAQTPATDVATGQSATFVGEVVEELEPPIAQDESEAPAIGAPDSSTVSAAEGDTGICMLPISAVVEDSTDDWRAQAQPEPQPEPHVPVARPKKPLSPRAKLFSFACACVVLMLLAYVIPGIIKPPPTPEEVWAKIIEEEYDAGKYVSAKQEFAKFRDDFPDHALSERVPFFMDMCDARGEAMSRVGDTERALGLLQKVYEDYRDTKQYEEYRADLFQALERLVSDFVEDCGAPPSKPAPLDRARESLELAQTVALSMPDDWVPKRVLALEQKIDDTGALLTRGLVRADVLALIQRAEDLATPASELDAIYREIQELLERNTSLANDPALQKQIAGVYEAEAKRVTYHVAADDTELVPPKSVDPDKDVYFVVWDEASAPSTADSSSKIYLAIARGVLYAFDSGGHHLWSRRLGFDSHRLPVAVQPSLESPNAFIAVSTLDNTLLALAKRDGRVLWQYRADDGQELSAPLTLTRFRPAPNKPPLLRGLLPTANGQVHVLELARGRRLGWYQTGFPMTVGGTYDPATRLAFFPADRQRVFALDPSLIEMGLQQKRAFEEPVAEEPVAEETVAEETVSGTGYVLPDAAKSVLFSGHPSGSLRSPPVVVGQYLIMTEASNLDHTAIRAFEIHGQAGFLETHAEALSELTLRGWSWFTPPQIPDRITVVTDKGDMGVCGVNLDNHDEALYLLIQNADGSCPSLSTGDSHRALPIHSNENLLWLMAGGVLRQMALDVLNQKVTPLWPRDGEPGEVVGMPLHEATVDQTNQRIYLTTKAPWGDQIEFSAIDANSGDRVWHQQLGISVATDPVLLSESDALLVDRSGRLLHAVVETEDESQRLLLEPDPEYPAAAAGDLITIEDLLGTSYLVQPLDGGRRLAVRPYSTEDSTQPWRELTLAAGARLQGVPAVLGDYMIIPDSHAGVQRLRVDGQSENNVNEQTYTWKAPNTLAPTDMARIYPLGEQGVLLIDGHRARWLEYAKEGDITQWRQRKDAFLADAPLVGRPLVRTDYVYLADEKNTIYRLPRTTPEADPPRWSLDGRITVGPFMHNGQMFIVLDDHRIVCYSLDVAPAEQQPIWSSPSFQGRICGRPAGIRRCLVVTDMSGYVTILSAASGESLQVISLGLGAVPSAAAVPLGYGRILAPLADGTLVWCNVPSPSNKQVARTDP